MTAVRKSTLLKSINYITSIYILGLGMNPIHNWLPIKEYFLVIKISPINFVFELIIQKDFYSNEVSWDNLNAYKELF